MPAACASTAAATVGCGGLETSTTTFVAGSSSSQRIPRSIEMPPIASARSWPPVPIACDTPEPSSWMRAVTSCVPVPEAPTTPIGPRRTTFANPSGMPLTIAVPQSGPMTIRSRSSAARLISSSRSTGTLSLKIITLMPSLIAFIASAAA